ncbi:MAG: hypothetical protein OXI50_11930 [Gammaproteobacteria bacterium]|nr:hypothetical protein [Gammaproteobacteria bacterium]
MNTGGHQTTDSPEHYAIYREAGWDRSRITGALQDALLLPGDMRWMWCCGG